MGPGYKDLPVPVDEPADDEGRRAHIATRVKALEVALDGGLEDPVRAGVLRDIDLLRSEIEPFAGMDG